jgi:hypothetical protein
MVFLLGTHYTRDVRYRTSNYIIQEDDAILLRLEYLYRFFNAPIVNKNVYGQKWRRDVGHYKNVCLIFNLSYKENTSSPKDVVVVVINNKFLEWLVW